MTSTFSEGGVMMWIILIFDFLILLVAVTALITSFLKGNRYFLQVASIVFSVIPLILGFIAYKIGMATVQDVVMQAANINSAVMDACRALL